MINIYISFCLFTFIFIFTIASFIYHRKKYGFKIINIISLLLVTIGEIMEIISIILILNYGFNPLSWYLFFCGYLIIVFPPLWFRKWYAEFLQRKFDIKPNIKIISIRGRNIDIINFILNIISAFIYIMTILAILLFLKILCPI